MAPTVLVIGAGLTGLTAARALQTAGLRVKLLDKGRAVGGRMATRRFGGATFDHGAQHFSVRTEEFAAEMRRLIARGVARVWYRSSDRTHSEVGIEERFVGTAGMRRIPEALAAGLDIGLGITIARFEITNDTVTAIDGDAAVADADAAVLTPPLPQTIQLLTASGVSMTGRLAELADVTYDATLAVMAVLDEPAGLPDGHLSLTDGPVAWMADNQHKGVSAVPALTVHSSAAFADEHLDSDPRQWAIALLAAARPHHRGAVAETFSHRWRYAQPRGVRDDGALAADTSVPVVLAGEAFAGARVEGAFTSGLAAARLIREMLM